MENEIEQLCKFAFNYSNMDTIFIDEMSNKKIDYGFTRVPDPLKPYFYGLIDKLQLNESTSEYIVLFHSNSYRLNFISAKVYSDNYYLGSIIIGPYLLEDPTTLMIESIILDNKMAISLKSIVKQYYLTLPMLSKYKANTTGEFLSYMVSTFNPKNFENFKIGNLTYDFKTEYSISPDIVKENTENAMEDLEKRYNIENSLMHAIELGNIELYENIMRKNNSLLTSIADRISNDPLRSAKNYVIVLNTLFRKAAEKGGLHPIYLDTISSKYASQIEKCTYLQQIANLINSMQVEYCDSVKKLSLKNYSSTVRKAIEFIRINLNNCLSLNTISEALYVSSYELSRQFKKETGETITEYINKRRINESVFILENESISITETSYMVGFNDVNYFTKVFKKIKGMTPSEYRKNKN
ncbi:helix-turn-helix domain-containing protein [Clostridium sp.]|uniref:helix-turn-helix domain-containing protein n=1 Tax=Clostridium sp. TaxID=1506 RepID=UPI001DB386D3|nr:helix-turn-helix domain-containing protein [Clostridium sp.]MBS5937936.1 AraC family transcriptional regulator [Clostridium sp.]